VAAQHYIFAEEKLLNEAMRLDEGSPIGMAYALIGDIRCAISSRASLMSEATCISTASGMPNTGTKTRSTR
jgi:hypothetical protein